MSSTDSLRDRIAAVVDDFYIYDPCWHPDDWKVAVANAVVEALPELNPDHIKRKYLKDWEEGYDEGYSAGGGGC